MFQGELAYSRSSLARLGLALAPPLACTAHQNMYSKRQLEVWDRVIRVRSVEELLTCLLGVVLGVFRWGGRGKAEPYTPVSKSEPYSTCLTPEIIIDASDTDTS